jgi:hypothetical protein
MGLKNPRGIAVEAAYSVDDASESASRAISVVFLPPVARFRSVIERVRTLLPSRDENQHSFGARGISQRLCEMTIFENIVISP